MATATLAMAERATGFRYLTDAQVAALAADAQGVGRRGARTGRRGAFSGGIAGSGIAQSGPHCCLVCAGGIGRWSVGDAGPCRAADRDALAGI